MTHFGALTQIVRWFPINIIVESVTNRYTEVGVFLMVNELSIDSSSG